jgi:MFS family permease
MSTERSSKGYRARLAALSLAMLLPSLGISIANVALPSLKAAFGGSNQDVQWIVIAYLVTLTAALVAAGRMGDLLGRRRLLIVGIGVFAVASAAAALAPHLWLLVLARSVQGIGAAIMMSLTIAAVGDMVPKDRTGSAMGLLGTVSAIGTALGPSLGGLLIAAFGWPAVFAFTAVAGTGTLLLAHGLLPPDVPDEAQQRLPFDVAGAALLVLSMGAFALAMTIGPVSYANGLLVGVAIVGTAAFVAVERRSSTPLVQVRLVRDRTVATGLLSIALVSAIMMTTLVVGPFYLSGALGLGAVATGLVMSVGPTVSALVGVPAGRLVDRFGSAFAIFTGLAGIALGTLSMALLTPAFGVVGYVGSLVLITAGYALFQAANNTAVMGIAGKDQRGVTSALLALARNLGLVTGASAMGSLFALGSNGLPILHMPPGNQTGLQLTFLTAAFMAGLAIVAWRGARSRS